MNKALLLATTLIITSHAMAMETPETDSTVGASSRVSSFGSDITNLSFGSTGFPVVGTPGSVASDASDISEYDPAAFGAAFAGIMAAGDEEDHVPAGMTAEEGQALQAAFGAAFAGIMAAGDDPADDIAK